MKWSEGCACLLTCEFIHDAPLEMPRNKSLLSHGPFPALPLRGRSLWRKGARDGDKKKGREEERKWDWLTPEVELVSTLSATVHPVGAAAAPSGRVNIRCVWRSWSELMRSAEIMTLMPCASTGPPPPYHPQGAQTGPSLVFPDKKGKV